MAYVYGPNWYQLLKTYGGTEQAPAPFQGRSLVPAGMPPGPSGEPPPTMGGADVLAEAAPAPAEGPETFDLGSQQSDDAFSQGSWSQLSSAEIRAKLRDFDPAQDDPAEYERLLVRIVAILEVRGSH